MPAMLWPFIWIALVVLVAYALTQLFSSLQGVPPYINAIVWFVAVILIAIILVYYLHGHASPLTLLLPLWRYGALR